MTENDASLLNEAPSPIYSHMQIWVDQDGSGDCTSNEVYSVADIKLEFDLDSISSSDFRYGQGWSLDATLNYTYQYYNSYGELVFSTPQKAYSATLESM